jgi:hypothetical protein
MHSGLSTKSHLASMGEDVEEHHKHKEELFSHTALYSEVLQLANDKTAPAAAVSQSLHKHMMSDINLPLPLAKLPATDGEQMAKQLLVAWAGFERPMKFLMEELHSADGEKADSEEVQEVQAELDYFKDLTKKLDQMVGGVGGGEEEGEGEGAGGGVGPGGGVGARPSTSTGANRKSQVLELAVQSFALLRHLCDKVKQAHAHEAVHAHESEHGATDPLLRLHHPLKDQWGQGKPPEIA